MKRYTFLLLTVIALTIFQPSRLAQAGGQSLASKEFRKTVEFEAGGDFTLKTDRGELRVEAFEVRHWGQRWPSEKITRGYNGYILRREGRALLHRAINDRFEGQSGRLTDWLRSTFSFPNAHTQQNALAQASRVAHGLHAPSQAEALRDAVSERRAADKGEAGLLDHAWSGCV